MSAFDHYCRHCGEVNQRLNYVHLNNYRKAKQYLTVAKVLWVLCLIDLYISLVATMLIDVENIVGTGPILFLLSIVLIVFSIMAKYRFGWLMGVWHCLLCFGIVYWINVWHVGPSQAHRPVLLVTVLYCFAVTTISFVALRWQLPERSPWLCSRCDYLLVGLEREGDCPECGLAFQIPDHIQEPEEKTLASFSK